MDTEALWKSVEQQFTGQIISEWNDKDWRICMNRIANKQLVGRDVDHVVRVAEDVCDIALVFRTLEQLVAAKRAAKETHRNQGRRSVGKPPILLAWHGYEVTIDGHNRTNIFVADGHQGPIECIVITPRVIA